ncbi:deleted in malignant brain tumors 1 protein-like [Engraulis encrasicolus]|uniref:deleted in malignant brain tumors 1 protein-like n=1 Tax=Engraulis encrasicolus TaxID=184585 RepID=UPI002FD45C68
MAAQEPDPCDHYTVLNDTWRATTNQDQSDPKCDANVQFQGCLEESSDCRYDYVKVHNGPSSSSPLLTTLCGDLTTTVNSTGNDLTVVFKTDGSLSLSGFSATYTFADLPSCRHNCGGSFPECSCQYSCHYNKNCCPDVYDYCSMPTTEIPTTPGSCRWNCGYDSGSCSCRSSCEYYGNCCHDYYGKGQPFICHLLVSFFPTDAPSCKNNCGASLSTCYCDSACHHNKDCCPDFYDYCPVLTTQNPEATTSVSCRWNCGVDFGSCSCNSSCEYYGNCCRDYYAQHPECGGYLSGSGTFSSPYHPSYYHDNAYCVWRLSAPSGQRVLLTFTELELERCCSCDYVTVHDGPSTGYSQLGKLCHNSSQAAFHSSSNHLTVLFRSDNSGVSRGFQAEFISSLSTDNGRVQCSGDNMNIVISRAFLGSQGYDNGNDLYVNDEHCRPSITSYQVIFNFPLNHCGTVREFKGGRVIYHNAVRAYRTNNGEITRQSTFKLSALCHMDSDSVSQILYEAHENETSTISGVGRFNTSMAFYTSSSFYQQIYDDPYVVALNDYLYVKVSLRRPDSSLVLFLDTCVASPNPHDYADHRSYDIVVNGCPRDPTYQVYSNGYETSARFRFRAFMFLRTHNTVYLQCKVLICPASERWRCRQQCQSRKARSLDSPGHQTDTLVLGPIKLRDPEKPVAKQLEDLVAKADA